MTDGQLITLLIEAFLGGMIALVVIDHFIDKALEKDDE